MLQQLPQQPDQGLPAGPQERFVGGAGEQGVDHRRVVLVGEDEVLLGGEVPEEGGRGDLGGGRDLVDRGVLVALLGDQPVGLAPDGLAGLQLLPLAQRQRRLQHRLDRVARSGRRCRCRLRCAHVFDYP